MKVKCIATRLSEEKKKAIKMPEGMDPSYDSCFVVGKEYIVLGVSHDTRPEYWTTHIFELPDELGSCTYAPLCLFEITDPRPSIFWQAKIINNELILWPIEFYQDFFHDLLSDGDPEVQKVFNSVVDRLTHEFRDTAPTVPHPLI